MQWKLYLITLLVLVSAGYMVTDGIYALVTGDYITPRSGANAGQLGPWSKIVQTIGLDPRSTTVKGFFVLQGTITLALLACYLFRFPWAANALKAAAIAGLWCLPIGTVISIIVLVLLVIA